MRFFSVTFFILALVVFSGCRDRVFDSEWTKLQAPQKFTARFETTKGDFDVEVLREYSPHAADRFYQLIKSGYFDDGMFYRVVPEFVAQFGNTNLHEMEQWRQTTIPDEPVRLKNTRGTLSFARAGKESRDLEVFINLADNWNLDTYTQDGVHGFPAFGNVVKGMSVVDKLYSGYGEATMSEGNLYLDRASFYRKYPKLDLIKRAYIIE